MTETICTSTDPGHLWAHVEAWGIDDIMGCADIKVISHLMCELGDKHQTDECHLLYCVVLSLHSFDPDYSEEIAYWQDKSRDWFPEWFMS